MAGELRAPLITLDPLAEGDSNIRTDLVTAEPVVEGTPALRTDYVVGEPVTGGLPNIRANYVVSEALTEGYRNLRASVVILELLQPVAPEGTVSTELFPGSPGSSIALPGLAYSVHKRPRFATGKHKASSGVSVRTSFMQYPIWEFELTYEFLIDGPELNSQLKMLMGFFLSRHGGFDTFLLKLSDDYLVENGELATADGVTTQFPFMRTLGGFAEKVGQVDTGETITLYGSVDVNTSIPATPGPYTITVPEAADFIEDLGVLRAGIPLVRVVGVPITGQYAVDILTGIYTFAAADESDAIVIRYRYELDPLDYTVTLPNLVVFDVAPAADMLISADFEFFFNCSFQEDVADFEKFANELWQLQQIIIETVPQ